MERTQLFKRIQHFVYILFERWPSRWPIKNLKNVSGFHNWLSLKKSQTLTNIAQIYQNNLKHTLNMLSSGVFRCLKITLCLRSWIFRYLFYKKNPNKSNMFGVVQAMSKKKGPLRMHRDNKHFKSFI